MLDHAPEASRAAPRHRASRLVLLALIVCGGCGAAPAPLTSSPLPELAEDRDELVLALGAALWDALVAGEPWRLLLGDDELFALLLPEEATRFAVRRNDVGTRLRDAASRVPGALAGATFLGVCAQDSRDEPGGGTVGLRRTAWVVSRALVAGRIAGGTRRIALWVDGTFVATSRGFRAIDLERIEAPRWEHSDLEILACDVSEGL